MAHTYRIIWGEATAQRIGLVNKYWPTLGLGAKKAGEPIIPRQTRQSGQRWAKLGTGRGEKGGKGVGKKGGKKGGKGKRRGKGRGGKGKEKENADKENADNT